MLEVSPWLVYWLMQLDNICRFVDIAAFLGSVILIVLFVFRTVWKTQMDHDDDYKVAYNATTLLNKLLCIAIPLFILINVFIPNTKTVAAMILIPPVVNNEQVQQIPDDILTFIRSVIKEYTPKESK